MEQKQKELIVYEGYYYIFDDLDKAIINCAVDNIKKLSLIAQLAQSKKFLTKKIIKR